MNQRFLKHYFSSRKPLILKEGTELAEKVKEVEEVISEDMTIWDDEETFQKYKKIKNLSLEERRLLIVFSLLDGSVNKVATLFGVDRKTITNRIEEIMKKIEKQ